MQKKNDFFDYRVRWNSSKFNEGNKSVDFDLALYVYAPSYRRWEKKFYQLEKNRRNPISAKALRMIPHWDLTYYEHDWYDLVKHDNVDLMETVRDNILGPGMKYFGHFSELPKALAYLKAEAPEQLETTLDLLFMHNHFEEAYRVFQKHLPWYLAQEKSLAEKPHTIYAYNRSKPLTRRKNLLNQWAAKHACPPLL